MIYLTEKAQQKIKELAAEQEIDKLVLRVKVLGGGCAGFSFDFHFEEVPAREIDEKFEFGDITLLIDPISHQYLDGTTIDYYSHGLIGNFKFENPNITSRCGCGKSFSA